MRDDFSDEPMPDLEGLPHPEGTSEFENMPDLELDLPPASQPMGYGASAQGVPAYDDAGYGSGEHGMLAQNTSGIRGPVSPASEPPVDPEEVARVSGFGAAPSGWLSAVPYTVLVASRVPGLWSEKGQCDRLAAMADTHARSALGRFGEQICRNATRLELSPVAGPLAAATEALARVDATGAEDATALGAAHAEVRALDERMAAEERVLGPFRDRENKLKTQLGVRQQDLSRAMAAFKRTEIEMRNAAAAGGETTAIEAARNAREAEAREAKQVVDELTGKLSEAQRQLAAQMGTLHALQRDKKRLEAELAQSASAQRTQLAQISDQAQDVLRALAVAVLTQQIPTGLPTENEARTALKNQRHRARQQELHARALQSFDREGVKQGAIILGGGGFVIFAALVKAIFF